MKPILRWFFVGGVAGLLVLSAPSARAQSASDSISQGPQGGQENPDKGTSTEGFPPLPEVGQSEPGAAGGDEGLQPGESGEGLRDFSDQQSGQNDAGPNNSGPDAGGNDLSAPR
jgi:hypothetical protein